MDTRTLEMRSSAVTLSDMEVFIFPPLIYSLMLANILSPRIWAWRDDPWFAGLERMTPYRRMTRIKQYIMDHYAFNLDLDTWGLTTQERELARFRDFIDADALAQSNALFGYEGDKYYFDIDIRSHFGLDKYQGNVIPYWKTETVEAMDAFRFRPGYAAGAGECVSLAVLYAAAMFIVGRIPLRDIYLMATPLHSQNFVDVDDGVLTNNRRLVTKAMWFNGTELSAQARRALEHERITVVAHESGWIHTLYPETTMAHAAYEHFCGRLRAYLQIPLTGEILGNFVRHSRKFQPCFQVRHTVNGRDRYIGAERAFAYEEECSYRVTDGTRPKLLAEVETEEFRPEPLARRIVLNDLETFIRSQRLDLSKPDDVHQLKEKFSCDCLNAEIAMESLIRFCHTVPRLPDPADRVFTPLEPSLGIGVEDSRQEIMDRLDSIRDRHPYADLAWHAYRDLNRTGWEPFVKAGMERNPVSVAAVRDLDDGAMVREVEALPNESIYPEDGRLAQPDEVWNYRRGDGAERALLLANLIRARRPEQAIRIEVEDGRAVVVAGNDTWSFPSAKHLRPQVWTM